MPLGDDFSARRRFSLWDGGLPTQRAFCIRDLICTWSPELGQLPKHRIGQRRIGCLGGILQRKYQVAQGLAEPHYVQRGRSQQWLHGQSLFGDCLVSQQTRGSNPSVQQLFGRRRIELRVESAQQKLALTQRLLQEFPPQGFGFWAGKRKSAEYGP